MEHKTFDLDLDLKSDDSGEFQAYFAAFGNVDHGNDRIEPGAFKNLDEFVKSGWIGLNHEHARLPVAYPVSAVQDAKGLLVTGRYHSTPDAQAVRTVAKERMHAGKAVKGSIGYRVIPETGSEKITIDGKSVRSLKGIDLKECSFVNLPMNPNADFVHSKSLVPVLDIEEYLGWIEAEVKSGRSVSAANLAELRAIVADGRKGLDRLGAFCDQHDPMYLMPPKSLSAEAADLHLQTLALCAKFGPFPSSP